MYNGLDLIVVTVYKICICCKTINCCTADSFHPRCVPYRSRYYRKFNERVILTAVSAIWSAESIVARCHLELVLCIRQMLLPWLYPRTHMRSTFA